jgi:preprotein translocase subunit YajC
MTGPAIVDLSLLAQGQQPSALFGLIPFILMLVVFYFLLILPAQRRQKRVNEMLSNLKSGDKVITNGGIYGKVVGLDGDTLLLQVAEQVRIKIARSAVAGMQAEPKESS